MSKKWHISDNVAWTLVILGGIMECFWVSGLKHANSPALYALTALGIVASFTCAMIAMKAIEVSICYAVFVGIGTAGIVVAEMLVFSEPLNLWKILFITLLLIGVIGLKALSGKDNKSDELAALSQNLGIDDMLSGKADEGLDKGGAR